MFTFNPEYIGYCVIFIIIGLEFTKIAWNNWKKGELKYGKHVYTKAVNPSSYWSNITIRIIMSLLCWMGLAASIYLMFTPEQAA